MSVSKETKADGNQLSQFQFTFNDLNFGNLEHAKKQYDGRKIGRLVVFRKFIRPEKIRELRAYVDRLSSRSIRRDFIMPQTGNTPRHMSIINGEVMDQQFPIMELYNCTHLRDTLSYITGRRIVDCANRLEHVIISDLQGRGDTHGRHKDDYPFALIMCIDAPRTKAVCRGGKVVFKDEYGRGYFALQTVSMHPGDAYLARTDWYEHEVTQLVRVGSRRRILNFTYDYDGNDVKTNGTAQFLLTHRSPQVQIVPSI